MNLSTTYVQSLPIDSDVKTETVKLKQELENMKRWAGTWRVSFEPAKCKALTISREKQPSRIVLYFGNTRVEEVDELQILDVTVDN